MKRLAIVAALLAIAVAAAAQPAPAPRLSDLGWLAGVWRSVEGQDVSEETWGTPEGDSMIGMWRWMSGGKLKLYESLAVVQGETGPFVLILRHLGPDGASREAAEAPIRLAVVSLRGREVLFEGRGSDGAPLRISYRSPSDQVLEGRVEHGEERIDFRFKRVSR